MGSGPITVQYLSLLVGVGLPLLVAFVTKMTAHPGLKAILLLFFSAVSGFLTEAINAWPNFNARTAVFTWAFTFATGVVAHYGFLKPTEISAAVARVGVK